jgi:hypothetical protein
MQAACCERPEQVSSVGNGRYAELHPSSATPVKHKSTALAWPRQTLPQTPFRRQSAPSAPRLRAHSETSRCDNPAWCYYTFSIISNMQNTFTSVRDRVARTAVPESSCSFKKTNSLERLHSAASTPQFTWPARNCCTATKCIHANVSRGSISVCPSPRRLPSYLTALGAFC